VYSSILGPIAILPLCNKKRNVFFDKKINKERNVLMVYRKEKLRGIWYEKGKLKEFENIK
jgi:hypothetical protein